VSSIRASTILLVLALSMSLLLSPAPQAQAQYEDLIARVKPAVVLVQVKHVLGGEGHGSGFLYDPSGFILTNQHVVAGAKSISVVLSDGRTLPATVVDYIRRIDYACPPRVETWIDAAVLKVEGAGLPTIPLGDSATLRQGQEVLVLGFPGGVGTEEVSVTRGIVGALRAGWFQTDATMLPGNSGGPVVDREGRVVGLATFGTGQFFKIGGVVAINSVRRMAEFALTPGAPRAQEFRVTGSEYVGPIVVGRKRVMRITYDPGNTSNKGGSAEYTTEITQVVNLAGAFLYTYRDSDGDEFQNFLDADGLFRVADSEKGWKTTFREPRVLLGFPTCAGLSWKNQWLRQNLSSGAAYQITESSRIQSTKEEVSTPAGGFSQVLQEGGGFEVVETKGGQVVFRSTSTFWWAPGMGVVRSVEERQGTNERWLYELLSHIVPTSSQ